MQANDLNANISAYGLCFGFCSIAQCFPTSIFVKIMHQGEHSKLYVYPTVKDFFQDNCWVSDGADACVLGDESLGQRKAEF